MDEAAVFMKNLLISLALFVVLAGFGAFVFMETAKAQNDLLTDLLNLPAPPPPNPLFQNRRSERPEDFFSKKTPPPDDAPIEDLLEYWQNQSATYRELGYNIKPSEKALERIMAEIEKNPNSVTGFVNILPENQDSADFVKRMYDSMSDDAEGEQYQRESLREWLKLHSNFFSDELVNVAQTVGDANEYVTHQDELLALTRVDFSKAQPILNRLYSDPTQPVSQTLARWALYRRALETDSFGDIERYRDELKAVVEDRTATPGQRDLALDALVKERDWAGRDDWYYSLLADETLADLRVGGQSYTGLTTIIYYAPPEKHIPRMLEFLKSSNPTIRNAAVRNLALLISKEHPEVIEALIPWLENPKWAKETGGERIRVVNALESFTLRESVPGLIEVLDEQETRQVAIENYGANSNRPIAAPVPVPGVTNVTTYRLRSSAIPALAMQKDARAVPALRRVLNEVEEYERIGVIRAILLSRGYSIPEQVDALEATARTTGEEEVSAAANMVGGGYGSVRGSGSGYANGNAYSYRAPVLIDTTESPVYYAATNANTRPNMRPISGDEIKNILGGLLVENPEADETLVTAVVDRIAALERKDPRTAEALRKILRGWNGPAINALLLKDLRDGKASVDTVVKILSLRKVLVEKQMPAVYDIRGGGPLAIAVAACLINDPGEYEGILSGENSALKTSLLACARLVRAELPVAKVAGYLGGTDKQLATAAERYLESNDSPEARAAVLAIHPNEAKVMGATTYFAPGDAKMSGSTFLTELFASLPGGSSIYDYYLSADYAHDLKETEKKLQKEVKESSELLGIYAYDDNFIRIFKDRAVFSWEEDPARYNERTLTPAEFDSFKSFLAASRVDLLPPFLSESEDHDEAEPVELLMLGRQGGRRVFMKGGTTPEFFERLDKAFEEMRKPPAKLHYWLEKDLPGLEILFADDDLKVQTVWKAGEDFRMLIEDQPLREQIDNELQKQEMAESSVEDFDYGKGYEINRKRRATRVYEHWSWRKVGKVKPAEFAAQPPQAEAIPQRDSFGVTASNERWKARNATIEIRADSEGLYKIAGGRMTKIRTGYYSRPLLVPGGRWVLATKYDEGGALVRVNLATNKEFTVEISDYNAVEPLAFVASLNRVLIRGVVYPEREEDGEIPDPQAGAHFLMDPETGDLYPVKGEVRPLAQQTFRPLQAATTPDEFWAAIPGAAGKDTLVGLYNAKMLSFKPVQKISRIAFTSMDMWVDEKENKVYFVYMGHLLGLPLRKAAVIGQ